MKKTVFIIGTNFCGSTIFARECALNFNIQMMGEINRMTIFQDAKNIPDEYRTNECRICSSNHKETICPIFSPGAFEFLEEKSFSDRYKAVRNKFSAPIALDGSKNPWWLAYCASRLVDQDISVILLVRLPWAVAHSIAEAEENTTFTRGIEVWRDNYSAALKIINQYNLPFCVIQYEKYFFERAVIDRALSRFLGINICENTRYSNRQVHAIGGNLGAYISAPNFNVKSWRDQLSGDKLPGSYYDAREVWKLDEKAYYQSRASIAERWIFERSYDELKSTIYIPGIFELANFLGLDLLFELERVQLAKYNATDV